MPDFSDPIESVVPCSSETSVPPTACQQDTTSAVGAACQVEPEMDPLQTNAIPCGEQVLGCTNRTALNYNPRATNDDGSCIFLQRPTISYSNQSLPVGKAILVEPSIGGGAYQTISLLSPSSKPNWLNFESSTGKFYGNSPNSFQSFTLSVSISNSAGSNNASFTITPIFPAIIPGCTNPNADNYDPLANLDNGSCQVVGCQDPLADNFNPQANVASPCIFYGCTVQGALNYDPSANTDDGSCVFCTPPQIKISSVTWDSTLNIRVEGDAFFANQVTVVFGTLSKTVNVTNNQWMAEFDPCVFKSLDIGGLVVYTATATTSCGTIFESKSVQKPPLPPCNCEDQGYFNTEADCLAAGLILHGATCSACEQGPPCGVSACQDVYPNCWVLRKKTCAEMGLILKDEPCVNGIKTKVNTCNNTQECYSCTCVGNINCWSVVSVSNIKKINKDACCVLSGTPIIDSTRGNPNDSALAVAIAKVQMTLNRDCSLCYQMYPNAPTFCSNKSYPLNIWAPGAKPSVAYLDAAQTMAQVKILIEDCQRLPEDHEINIVLKKVCCE